MFIYTSMKTKLKFASERTSYFHEKCIHKNTTIISKCYGKIFYFHTNSDIPFKNLN